MARQQPQAGVRREARGRLAWLVVAAASTVRRCITCDAPVTGALERLGAVQCDDCRAPRRVSHPFP